MKRGVLFVGFVLIFSSAHEAVAQGHFVRHGFRVFAPSYSLSSNRSKLAFGAGYHLRRIIELGFGLERVSDSRPEIVTVSWVPFAAVYPLSQSDSMPVSVRLGVAYESQSLSGDPITRLEEQGVRTEGSAYRLEAGLSRRMDVSRRVVGRKVAFVPILSFVKEWATVEMGDQSSEDRLISLYVDLIAEIDAGELAHVIFGPRVGIIDDEFGAGFSLGLVAGYGY